jgi:ribosomal-protein-alanine N-acetyltransferase
MSATRLVAIDDAPAITALLIENREFMAPWEPCRDDAFFTVEAQRKLIAATLERKAQGLILPHVILDETRVVGRINLNNIVRGAFQSASLGYWVSAKENGRGLATVSSMKRVAFGQLDLHRLEAGTLLHNTASQRVLQRNGFERFGLAPRYVKIAGQWQDHILFQVLNENAES